MGDDRDLSAEERGALSSVVGKGLRGKDINKFQRSRYYDQILTNYCESMRANLVGILLRSGFSINLRGRKNEIEEKSLITLFTGNALHNAVGFWRRECIKKILKHRKNSKNELSFNLTIVDDSNRTPGQIAVDIDKRVEWYKLLEECLCDYDGYKALILKEKNRNFNATLREAIRNLDEELLHSLLCSCENFKNRIDLKGLDYTGKNLKQLITRSKENKMSEQEKLAFKGKVVQMFNDLGYQLIIQYILSEENVFKSKNNQEKIQRNKLIEKGKENILIESV